MDAKNNNFDIVTHTGTLPPYGTFLPAEPGRLTAEDLRRGMVSMLPCNSRACDLTHPLLSIPQGYSGKLFGEFDTNITITNYTHYGSNTIS